MEAVEKELKAGWICAVDGSAGCLQDDIVVDVSEIRTDTCDSSRARVLALRDELPGTARVDIVRITVKDVEAEIDREGEAGRSKHEGHCASPKNGRRTCD